MMPRLPARRPSVFSKISIKGKLMVITMATVLFALLLTVTAVLYYDRVRSRDYLVQDISSSAQLLANRSSAALLFDDKRVAKENLTALQAKQAVIQACLFSADNVPIAEYQSAGIESGDVCQKSSDQHDGYRFQGTILEVFHPVIANNQTIGTLLIRTSLAELDSRWQEFTFWCLAIFSSVSMVAFFVAGTLRRIVTKPLNALTLTAQYITDEKDFSVRASHHGNDEFGILTHTFNVMLETLEKQNHQLLEVNADLDQKVRERTRQLEQAKLEAEAASQAKSEFLANMSHEVRTPMNAIMGMIYLVKNTDLSVKQHGYLNKISFAAQSLLKIINDILDFSKIEAGQLDLEHVPFSLDELLGNLADLVGFSVEEKGLEIIFSVAPEVPRQLVGDPLRLGQILLNLTNNAVKFTEQGEILISVSVESLDAVQCRLRFTIRDGGIGMTPTQIQNLFKAFSQADSSITRRYGGTGLGLIICRQLVGMMNGEISVESVPMQGSTFRFSVCLSVAPSVADTLAPHPVDFQGKRTLVVDDNFFAREILSVMLDSLGFVVETATSGIEALECIRIGHETDQPFDLVLMDWRMPNMNGIEAASIIKADTRLTKTPAILLITTFFGEDLAQQAQQVGLDGFLLKPITEAALINAVGMLFGQTVSQPIALEQQVTKNLSVQGRRILLVEDNAFNRDVALEMLQELHLEVDCALNGQECIKMLNNNISYDLVLMDIQMPVMDGLKATRLIRTDPRFEHLPIIAMTAHAMAEDREKSLVAGMNDHLVKPVNPRQLATILQRWLGTEIMNADNSLEQAEVDSSVVLLDLTQALQFADGDEGKMRNRMVNFYSCYEKAPEQLDAMLLSGDYESIKRMAHTLKSASGYIGALRLQFASSQLWANTALMDQFAATLRQELQAVLTELSSALPPIPLPSSEGLLQIFPDKQGEQDRRDVLDNPPGNAASTFADALEQMEALICKGDARASIRLSELECSIAGEPMAAELAAIRDAFEELDLTLALSRLTALREACAINEGKAP